MDHFVLYFLVVKSFFYVFIYFICHVEPLSSVLRFVKFISFNIFLFTVAIRLIEKNSSKKELVFNGI